MIYLHFIVNPISGKGNHIIDLPTLRNHFPCEKFKVEIEYSEYKMHAKELASLAVLKKPDCIIACGGDGTINEVASAIVGTNIKLGILPFGSGNGLASNLGIPKDIEKAISIIKNGYSASIDIGRVNKQYFLSNMGIGIDAMIIKKYEESKKRTLLSYLKASLSVGFKFKSTECKVSFKENEYTAQFFLLFVSNSNEMGYNMSLTPKANLNDGLLDLLMVPQLSLFEKLQLGCYILCNKVPLFSKANYQLIKECTIELPQKTVTYLQIDGEFHELETNKINIDILEKSLEIIIPIRIRKLMI